VTRADDTANERPRGRPDRPAGAEGSGDGDSAGPRAPGQPLLSDPPDETGLPPRIGYIGKRLGRFHISAELGRGGMATVYRAHDPHVGRDVAVKVMHGFFAGRADIETRFRREANAVAAIRHPSILALYDFSPPSGEEPGYIVSELIEGPALRVLADEHGGRLLPEVAAAIATRVAEALGAAHAAGIVHRDVKPDNVLIDRTGGGVRVVLTDFGVAHVGNMDTMTATGAVLGSPAFMSPEQARGDEVGPTSDVFSLGVLLYQLVTGHLPFSGKEPLALIAAILRGEYIRPGKLEARVGPELEQVIVRCLQRAPAARFPDGRAVAAALRATLSAADFPDEEALLRRALPDLDAFTRATAPQIAERAVAAAELARKRRQIPRALAEVGRALAYVPEHPVARALLDRLGARRRSPWLIAGGAAAALAAIAIVAAVGVRRGAKTDGTTTDGTTGVPTAVPAAPAPPRPQGLTVTPPPPEPAPPAEQAPPPDVAGRVGQAPPATAPTPARPRRRPSATGGTTRVARVSKPDADGPAGEPAVGVAPPQPNPVPAADPPPVAKAPHDEAPAAAPPVVAAASIVLHASQGFCEPSLDDSRPSLRVSVYSNLTPGPHIIYCTLPQGGGKVKVATYDLRPGARPSLIIVRGPGGRPILSRPE
jgi:hypothetical protein